MGVCGRAKGGNTTSGVNVSMHALAWLWCTSTGVADVRAGRHADTCACSSVEQETVSELQMERRAAAARRRAQRDADDQWRSLRGDLDRAQREATGSREAAAAAEQRAAVLAEEAAGLRAKVGELGEERELLKRLLDGLLSEKAALAADCSALSAQVGPVPGGLFIHTTMSL